MKIFLSVALNIKYTFAIVQHNLFTDGEYTWGNSAVVLLIETENTMDDSYGQRRSFNGKDTD